LFELNVKLRCQKVNAITRKAGGISPETKESKTHLCAASGADSIYIYSTASS
jgi:hypothetical protein